MKIKLDTRGPDWAGWHWFSLSAPAIWVHRGLSRPILIWLWDCFHRETEDGRHWGIGLLNISGRHLVYVGHEKADVLFVHLWRARGPR